MTTLAAIAAGGYDLVVFDRTAPSTETLTKIDTASLWVGPPVGGPFATAEGVTDPQVTRVRAGDPLLEGVDLSGATFGPTPIFTLGAGDEEIVGSADGPLLFRTEVNDQPAVVLTVDPETSNLPKRVAFPVLIANMVEALAPDGIPAAIPLGEPLVYEPRASTASVEDRPALRRTRAASGLCRGDCKTRATSRPGSVSRDIVYTDTGAAGVYTVTETDAAGIDLGTTRFVVNAGHPRESDLRVDPESGIGAGHSIRVRRHGTAGGARRSLAAARPRRLAGHRRRMDSGTLAGRAQRDEAARPQRCDVTSLVWARPDALWLLALVPLFALTGIWLGIRRGRLQRVALLWRLAVVTLLAVGLAEPMIASGSATGGAVFVVDRSASIGAEARDAADRWLRDALAAAPPTRRAAIVAFGAKPVLATAPGSARDLLDDDAAARRLSRWRRGRSRVHRHRCGAGLGAGPAARRRAPHRARLRWR